MEEKDRRTFSCADCGLKGCREGDGKTPPFCPGDSMPEGLLEEAMAEFLRPDLISGSVSLTSTMSACELAGIVTTETSNTSRSRSSLARVPSSSLISAQSLTA